LLRNREILSHLDSTQRSAFSLRRWAMLAGRRKPCEAFDQAFIGVIDRDQSNEKLDE
jgi:hypothetical protein